MREARDIIPSGHKADGRDSAVGLVGYWLAGGWGSTVNRYFVLSLPVAGIAMLLGRAIHRRMTGASFLRYVHVALIITGVALLVEGVVR